MNTPQQDLSTSTETYLKQRIRTIRGWPIPSVNFRDITSLLNDPGAFSLVIEHFAQFIEGRGVTRIAGIESRGFILGGALALKTGLPLSLVRKQGKLPPPTIHEDYSLEYGTATLEIRHDACSPEDLVLIVDDLIATGGTLEAAASLFERMGAGVAGIAVIIDLPELGGSHQLKAAGRKVFSLCSFSESE